jgi:hypothetical protein
MDDREPLAPTWQSSMCSDTLDSLFNFNRKSFHLHNLQGVRGRAGAWLEFVVKNQPASDPIPEVEVADQRAGFGQAGETRS